MWLIITLLEILINNSDHKEDKMDIDQISELLADDAAYLLEHKSKTVTKDRLHLPVSDTDRFEQRGNIG